MKINRLMIAAPQSASGKTSITIALLRSLQNIGMHPVAVKCGPDYIDPMFHRAVLGIPSCNLDTYFTNAQTAKELFIKDCSGVDIAITEGVMGLYDGVGGVLEEGSSYSLAKATSTPVLLVVNAKGAGKSIVALIKGFLDYDTEGLIRGVILNRVSGLFFAVLKEEIERELPIRVLGFLPDLKDTHLESRHLGLITPDRVKGLNEIIDILAEEFEKNADMGGILAIAESAPELTENAEERPERAQESKTCIIAVSKDEAFQFFYEENIRLLRECGASIVYFSPVHDGKVPENADALILTGGYPESCLDKLCSNESMKESIRESFAKNMPVLAECGGFLYFHKTIEDCNGRAFEGAGVVDANCRYTGKSVRFGYVEIREKEPFYLKDGEGIRGHEFHYYESTDNGNDCTAAKPFGNKTYECIHKTDSSWIGFPHLYYPSNPDFAVKFVNLASEYRKKKEKENG